jgi:hypothetical protein
MARWRGFLVVSKSYMGYDTMSTRERFRFWCRYPKAASHFCLLSLGDWLRKTVAR